SRGSSCGSSPIYIVRGPSAVSTPWWTTFGILPCLSAARSSLLKFEIKRSISRFRGLSGVRTGLRALASNLESNRAVHTLVCVSRRIIGFPNVWTYNSGKCGGGSHRDTIGEASLMTLTRNCAYADRGGGQEGDSNTTSTFLIPEQVSVSQAYP
ncbi:unnamed protein product, partial [Ectocarpus sp. 12 AP-2014]